jgi:hypothetical protein
MRVYKVGRRLPTGDGITSLLANPQWTVTYYRNQLTKPQSKHICGRDTPFFVCATLDAAITVGTLPPGRLPEGVIVEVWEAETPEVFAALPWFPLPDQATPEWFAFWQSYLDYGGHFLTPDLTRRHFHRVKCPEQTLLCFELTLLAPICMVPARPQARRP